MDKNNCVIGIDEVFLKVNKLWDIVQERIKEYPFPKQEEDFLTEFQKFIWDKTPEGYDYWYEVHTRFKAYRELHWNMQPFERFLHCNNIYIKYMKNSFGGVNDSSKKIFNIFLLNTYWKLYLNVSFDWGETPEGFSFWKKYNKKWLNLMKNK